MSDISITPANVVRGTGAELDRSYNAGATITAGQVVYLKTSDTTWRLAQADGTAEEAGGSTVLAIALHGASSGQPLAVQKLGQITIGGTVTVGTVYVVSAAAGGICPWADLVSTNKVTLVGIGVTAAVIEMKPLATGVAIP